MKLARRGDNWGVPRDAESVRFGEAQALCAKLGASWRLPQDVFLRVLCMNKQCRPELQREKKGPSGDAENKGAAICVNF